MKVRVGGIFEREFKISEYPELQWFVLGIIWLLGTIVGLIKHNPYWIVGGFCLIFCFEHSYVIHKKAESIRVNLSLYEGLLDGMERVIKRKEMWKEWKEGKDVMVNNKITILGRSGENNA